MNKKKIFGSIAVLAIVAMAAFNVNVNLDGNKLLDISLTNIEALADPEGKGETWNCKSSSIWCYYDSSWVYGDFYRL